MFYESCVLLTARLRRNILIPNPTLWIAGKPYICPLSSVTVEFLLRVLYFLCSFRGEILNGKSSDSKPPQSLFFLKFLWSIGKFCKDLDCTLVTARLRGNILIPNTTPRIPVMPYICLMLTFVVCVLCPLMQYNFSCRVLCFLCSFCGEMLNGKPSDCKPNPTKSLFLWNSYEALGGSARIWIFIL